MKTTETTIQEVQTENGPITLVKRDAENLMMVEGKWVPYFWTDYGVRRPFGQRPFGRIEEARAEFTREVELATGLGWVR